MWVLFDGPNFFLIMFYVCSLCRQCLLVTLLNNLTFQKQGSSLASSLSSKSLVFLDPEAVDNIDGGVTASRHVKSVPLLIKRSAKSAHHLHKLILATTRGW